MKGPELVVIVADLDTEAFVKTLVLRGMERGCLRPFTFDVIRDTKRDHAVATQPTRLVAHMPFEPARRFLVIWDHHGSGRERDACEVVESNVRDAFVRIGVAREAALAVAFAPELEVVFGAVWARVRELLAAKRGDSVSNFPWDARDPKAAFEGLARRHRVKAPPLFEEIAKQVSLKDLKGGDAIGRIASTFVEWFGTTGGAA